MPNLRFKIRNAKKLEARIAVAARNYANAAFNAIEKELEKTGARIIRRIENSEEYRQLVSDPILRGKLGLAAPGRKSGGDTDAPDLIRALGNFKVTRNRAFNTRRFRLEMPSLQDLEQQLTHRLTTFGRGAFLPGPIQSWFRWWEFGDRGEIDTLTVFQRSSAAAAGRLRTSRVSLNRLIAERSRSGSAIQIASEPANDASSITGSNLIGRTYANFGRILPAQLGKVLRQFTRNNKPNSFFARVVR